MIISKVWSISFFIIVFLEILQYGQCQKQKIPKTLPIFKQLRDWNSYMELSHFLSFSLQMFGDESCHIIIYDWKMSIILDYFTFCSETNCRPKYTLALSGIFSENLNFTLTLKESYRRQCGAYLILLSNASDVLDLLRYGDDFRAIHTKAKFLIWNGEEDHSFDSDEVWRKIPNVIFFHTKLNLKRAPRNRRVSISVKSIRWPVIVNATPTFLVDVWRNGALGKTDDKWYRDKTLNLRNITLRILAVEHPPSVVKYKKPDGFVEYAGSEIEVIKELSVIMNFDFELIDGDPVTKWGGIISSRNENDTQYFFGGVGKIINGEVDIGIGSFLVLKHLLEHLDMSIPLHVACTSFITPNPLPRPRYLALILPFQFALWALVLLICFIFAPVAIYSLGRIKIYTTEYKIFSTRWHSLFTSISIVSQVSLHKWPKFWTIRQFVVWHWIFCLLITLAYRCAMVSFLTIPLYERPIDNLRDLLNSGLRIGGWGVELKNLFTGNSTGLQDPDSARSQLSKIYELIDDYDTGINLIIQRKFALYENLRYLRFIRMTRNLSHVGAPSMRLMKQCVLPVHIAFAYQKNSPIASTINSHVRRFQESGLLRRWSQRLIVKTKQFNRDLLTAQNAENGGGGQEEEENEEEQGDDEAGNDDDPSAKQRKQRVLTMGDLQGAIFLVIFGNVLATLIFFGEYLSTRRHYKIIDILNQKLNLTLNPNIEFKFNRFNTFMNSNQSEFFRKIKTTKESHKKKKELRLMNSVLKEMNLLKETPKGLTLKRRIKRLTRCESEPKFPYLE